MDRGRRAGCDDDDGPSVGAIGDGFGNVASGCGVIVHGFGNVASGCGDVAHW